MNNDYYVAFKNKESHRILSVSDVLDPDSVIAAGE